MYFLWNPIKIDELHLNEFKLLLLLYEKQFRQDLPSETKLMLFINKISEMPGIFLTLFR